MAPKQIKQTYLNPISTNSGLKWPWLEIVFFFLNCTVRRRWALLSTSDLMIKKTNSKKNSRQFTNQVDIPVVCLDKKKHIMNFVGLQKQVLAVALLGSRLWAFRTYWCQSGDLDHWSLVHPYILLDSLVCFQSYRRADASTAATLVHARSSEGAIVPVIVAA